MKIIVISDTHNRHNSIILPEGDMIIHCGDFSDSEVGFKNFIAWFSKLDYKYKILVSGNHDFFIKRIGYENILYYCDVNGIIYLQDTSINIEGIKFHGSPWTPKYGEYAFMEQDEKLKKHWRKIPLDTEVLITHGPAYKIGDLIQQDIMEPNAGSKTLKKRIISLQKLKYHFFGHIHDDYGVHPRRKYIACNASIINYYKQELNKPIIVEIY